MQYHLSLITADGAYHCPLGSIMAIFVFVVALATSDNGVVACFGLGGPSDGTGVVDVVVLGGASDDTGVVAGFAFVALLLLHLAATTPFPSFLPK